MTTIKLNSNRYSITSIVFSILCLIGIIKINHDIAQRYLASDGKTQALFGITELLCFSYQYYFVFISLIALVLAIIGSKRKESRLANGFAYLLGFLSLLLIFARVWRVMV